MFESIAGNCRQRRGIEAIKKSSSTLRNGMEDASLEKSHRSVQVKSYERSENGTLTTSKWGTKQEGQEKYTGRSNPTGKSILAFERNEEKSRKCTGRSNPKGKRNLAFERKEGNVKGAFEPSVQRSKIPRLGQWEFA